MNTKVEIWESEMPFAGDDVEKYVAKFAKRFKVNHEMTNPYGPSGGWPEFVFWGPRNNMEKLVKAYNRGAGLTKAELMELLDKSHREYTAV